MEFRHGSWAYFNTDGAGNAVRNADTLRRTTAELSHRVA